MTNVELLVRDTPCRDHPDEEWLTFKVGGQVIMELCTGALRVLARGCRGRDMIGGGGCEVEGARKVPTAPPDTPADPQDFSCFHVNAQQCKCQRWAPTYRRDPALHHCACPYYGRGQALYDAAMPPAAPVVAALARDLEGQRAEWLRQLKSLTEAHRRIDRIEGHLCIPRDFT